MINNNWKRTTIKKTCHLVNGRAFKPSEWARKGLPIIRIQNLNNPNAQFNYCNFPVDDKYYVDDGDLLFAWSGTPGTSFGSHIWNKGKAVLNQHIFKVIINEMENNKSFFMYLLNNNVEQYIKKAHGAAGLAHITKGTFENSEIELPPKKIQDEIVYTIETQFTRLDAAIKSLKTIQQKLDVYRKSVLKAAFDENLVETKSEWNEYRIKDIAEKIQYGLTSQSGMNYKGPRYLRITDIQDRKVDWEKVPFAKETDRTKDYALQNGDLVFARTGATVGKSFLIKKCPKGAVFASYLIRVAPQVSKILPDLLWYYFQSPMYWGDISRSQRGIGQPNVNGQILSNLLIKIPIDLQGQEQIVSEIESRFSVIDKLDEVIANSLQKAERLRKSILKAAFEGKLVQ